MVNRFVLLFAALLAAAAAVDYEIYKTCEEREFCNRLRQKEGGNHFYVIPNAALHIPSGVSLLALNRETNKYVEFNVTILPQDTFKVTVEELEFVRYSLPYVFETEPSLAEDVTVSFYDDRAELTWPTHKLIVYSETMKMDAYWNDRHVFTFNNDGRLTMEDDPDYQPFAFDVFFPEAVRSYGIPEHADRMALRTTTYTSEPYRLYNSDTPAYDVNSRLALYGSVPLLWGHSTTHTVAVFLKNAAEQWVDITNSASGVSAYWMVEGGALEFYFFLGPEPQDVMRQYNSLVGTAPIPPLWSLGYHQSRWNYNDQEDVKDVIANFDAYTIPIDVIWGDVETQDYHRYFTWNPETFDNPLEMLSNLSSTRRRFVTHVDPHYKVDDDYFVYAEGKANGYFVKNSDGTDFVGECWPGESSWIDFFNEQAVEWYAGLFSYDIFKGTTSTLAGIWNDMNEPAVFNDETEKTISRDVVFNGNIPHRDVHNMYGFTQVRATHEGLMNRDNRELRPFILSRSFFAGTQRYAAIWTGDNVADWEHLSQSYAMCLTIGLAGISFCGADVGGFYGDPDPELLTRWYQAGAWLPFFRGHAANGTERREPYLFEREVTDRIRAAIRKRYQHLPLFYTLFYEHMRYGDPVIRPTFYVYPEDANVMDIDHQLFLGDKVLIKAVYQSNVTTVPVYFPGGREQLWYDIDTPLLYRGLRWIDVNTNPNYIPVYYRGGNFIFLRTTQRRNTYEYYSDAYTGYVFLNEDEVAHGTLYEDDYESFAYARRDYQYYNFTFERDSVIVRPIDADHPAAPTFLISSYVLYRPPSTFTRSIDGPAHVEPLVFTQTADGKEFKDLRFENNEMRFKLF